MFIIRANHAYMDKLRARCLLGTFSASRAYRLFSPSLVATPSDLCRRACGRRSRAAHDHRISIFDFAIGSLQGAALEPVQLVCFTVLAFQNGFFWQQVLRDAKPAT
jgi:hypothetical protein